MIKVAEKLTILLTKTKPLIMEKVISCEEQDDLRIVEHLNIQNLPSILENMLSLASTPEEQDILLMSTLAGASACTPVLCRSKRDEDVK